MFKGKKIILHPMTPEQIVKADIAKAKQQQQQPHIQNEIKLKAPVLLATKSDFDDVRDDKSFAMRLCALRCCFH
jgi:hypothetical protein